MGTPMMFNWLLLQAVVFGVLVSQDGANCRSIDVTDSSRQGVPSGTAPSGDDQHQNKSWAITGSIQQRSGPGHKNKYINTKSIKNDTQENDLLKAKLKILTKTTDLKVPSTSVRRITRKNKSEGSLVHSESNKVAFTVMYEGIDQGPYPQDKVVTFNRIRTNIGGGFDKMFSVFSPKVPGLYFFSFALLGTFYVKPQVKLMLNSKVVVKGDGYKPHGTAVGTATLQLVAYDRVWLVIEKNTAIYGADMFNSFSGFLVA